MKKRILLVDESLTVQKVVALTLDKNRYTVSYAKSRAEVMKTVMEAPPDLILVSDQVADINIGSFPRELEAWVGRDQQKPPVVLITGQDIKEMRQYQGVLKKPFAPQTLQNLVTQHAQVIVRPPPVVQPKGLQGGDEEGEDTRLQQIFNEAFADEANLVRETFRAEVENEERTLTTIPKVRGTTSGGPPPAPTPVNELWDPPPQAPETRMAQPPAPPARPARPPAPTSPVADLWGVPAAPPPRPVPTIQERAPSAAPRESRFAEEEEPMAYSNDDLKHLESALQQQVDETLGRVNLQEYVDRALNRLLPPIVEKLVQERLDRLLKDQEQMLELKQ